MAFASSELEDFVVFELTDPSNVTDRLSDEEITISTSVIDNWDIPSIVFHRIVKVQADRNRLSQKSYYFHGLLSGSFSESTFHHISINWSMESFLNILHFIYGRRLIVTPTNFLNLLEAALFFGVDGLLLECDAWFQKITSGLGLCRRQISLAVIIEISNFSMDHGITSIMRTCKEYLARNFGQGLARNFIMDAASKLPLLRKLSLDLCDAIQGGLDSPSHSERFYLSTVKICRCKAQRCAFDLEKLRGFKPVHKETIVLEYTSWQLRTTVVKERI